ncbi:MAG: hypothetical protein GY936_19435 [Ignavibacteriae bacterium]|nr:hypothetical protein [Ignavibacteriota bacterium]
MDELNNNEDLREKSQEVEEISVTDKMVGVLSEPTSLFEKISKLELKSMDWLIPVLLVIIIASVSQFVMMSNPEIKAQAVDKQIEVIEKQFKEAVDKGNMTQDQADDQLEMIRDRMDEGGSSQMIMTVVGIVIITFLVFFIIAGVFYLLVKFGLAGEGSYKTAMTAYGMPYYIVVLQFIVMIILAITMNKMITDTSVGTFLDMGKDTLVGMLSHKLDIFSIWFYAVISISFAKMFKSDNTAKYFIMIFGVWIGVSLLMYFITQAVPFLSFLNM